MNVLDNYTIDDFDYIKEDAEIVASFNSIKTLSNHLKKDYTFYSENILKDISSGIVETISKIFKYISRMIKTILKKLTGGRLFGDDKVENNSNMGSSKSKSAETAQAVTLSLQSILDDMVEVQLMQNSDFKKHNQSIHTQMDNIELSEYEIEEIQNLQEVLNIDKLEKMYYNKVLNQSFKEYNEVLKSEDQNFVKSYLNKFPHMSSNLTQDELDTNKILSNDILKAIPTKGNTGDVRELVDKFFSRLRNKSNLVSYIKNAIKDDIYPTNKGYFNNASLMLLYSDNVTGDVNSLEQIMTGVVRYFDKTVKAISDIQKDGESTITGNEIEKAVRNLSSFKNPFLGENVMDIDEEQESADLDITKINHGQVNMFTEYLEEVELININEVLAKEKSKVNRYLFGSLNYFDLNKSLDNLKSSIYYSFNNTRRNKRLMDSLNDLEKESSNLADDIKGKIDEFEKDSPELNEYINGVSTIADVISYVLVYYNNIFTISEHQIYAVLAHEQIKKAIQEIFLIKFALIPVLTYDVKNNITYKSMNEEE